MSAWTHLTAVVEVDTFIEDDNIKTIVEEKLKLAPKITGSEMNADIFVNVPNWKNTYISFDCKKCIYLNTLIEDVEEFSCTSPEDYTCPSGEYQTRAIITICGNLRDRVIEETEKQYIKFMEYLKKECNFMIKY